MTKCAFGFLGKNGSVELEGMTVECDTDFAVIALSSLSKSPITDSDNLLLTAVGRAKNTDSKFINDIMTDIGKPPVLIENIQAVLEFETSVSDLVVWAISAEGYYIGTVPSSYENGRLKIKIGEVSQSMYYLISKA